SVTVFSIVMKRLSACSICCSVTSTMSSTRARTIGDVMRPGALTAMPSAREVLLLDEGLHRWIEGGLHADDLDIGLERLGGDSHAGYQAASADRYDQDVEVRHRSEHLERDSALTGNDHGIVVRVDERQPRLAPMVRRQGGGFLEGCSTLDHV